MNEIVKVDPKEYGLTDEMAVQITKDLPTILKERESLEAQYFMALSLDLDDPKSSKTAGDLRKLIKDNRTKGIEKWHKVNKEYFLRGGQFIDAIKRKEVGVNERMEAQLEQIEKYQEIKEQKRLAELQLKRAEALSFYIEDAPQRQLASMDEETWKAYLSARKKEHEEKVKAEKDAETARLKAIEEERLENERIRIDNDRLRKEREDSEKLLIAERKASEEKLRLEQENARKMAAELEAKKQAELEAKIQDRLRKEAELNKGDEAKVFDLKNDLIALKSKYSFSSEKNRKMYSDVGNLIDKIVNFIK